MTSGSPLVRRRTPPLPGSMPVTRADQTLRGLACRGCSICTTTDAGRKTAAAGAFCGLGARTAAEALVPEAAVAGIGTAGASESATAGASAASFAVGAALPMATAALVPEAGISLWVTVLSLIFLAVLGAIGAKAGGAPIGRAVVRVTFWGAVAMAVTAVVGTLFGAVI